MTKKGVDEDRLKFFKGMGASDASESVKAESEETGSVISESDRSESRIAEPDKSESAISESDISDSDNAGSDIAEYHRADSDRSEYRTSDPRISESVKPISAISESDLSESDITRAAIKESDISEPRIAESDKRRPTSRSRKQAPKITLPKSRAPSSIPKVRARKVDDSVLDMALTAALKSPKVSIYSPFVAAVMKCNEMTTIGYKSSADSRELLERALEQEYPDVCEKVRRYMENNRE
jgi:hypothetical protein